MASLYEQYQQLTPKEREYLHHNPHHAMILKDARESAFAEAIRRFGKNGRNDKSDAAHESSPKNRLEEKRMDMHNNRIGPGSCLARQLDMRTMTKILLTWSGRQRLKANMEKGICWFL